MKIHITIAFFISLFFAVKSAHAQFSLEQQKQIDSINLVIKNTTSHDTSVVNGYLQLVELYGYSNIDTILPLTNAAKKVAERALATKTSPLEEQSLKSQLANIHYNLGYYYQYKGEIPLALNHLNKCYDIQKNIGEKQGQAATLNVIGYIYEDLGDIKKALDYYERSIAISEESQNLESAVSTLINLGMLYNDQNDVNKAVEYTKRSLEIATKIDDKYTLGVVLNNFGTVYSDAKNYEKALEYYQQSIDKRKEIEDYRGLAYSLSGMAHCLKRLSEKEKEKGNSAVADSLLKSSLENLNESLKIRVEIGDKRGEIESLNYLGKYYYELNNVEKAYSYYSKSLKLAEQLGYPKLIERNAKLLFMLEKGRGNYEEALKMRDLQVLMKDSIENESNLRATLKQQSRYEYEKQKALDDAENEKRIAIEKEKQERQFIVLIITIIAAAIVAMLLLIIYRRLQLTRKQKIIIEDQKEEVEAQRDQIEEQRDDIVASINYAKRIQNAILPALSVVKEHLPNSFVLYKPKDVVAGDFYWLEKVPAPVAGFINSNEEIPQQAQHDNSVILFAAADCTGHGVPGAMVSVVCHNAMNRAVREFGLTEPGLILDKTREIVLEEFSKSEDDVKDGMDIALCSLRQAQTDKWELQYAGAHNPLWIVRPTLNDSESDEGEKQSVDVKNSDSTIHSSYLNDEFLLFEIKADKQPIGKFENPTPFTTHSMELQKGDSIYVFSDGFTDQFGGESDKKLGSRQFKELLLSIQHTPMQEQQNALNNIFEKWIKDGSTEQIDDVCILGVKM